MHQVYYYESSLLLCALERLQVLCREGSRGPWTILSLYHLERNTVEITILTPDLPLAQVLLHNPLITASLTENYSRIIQDYKITITRVQSCNVKENNMTN